LYGADGFYVLVDPADWKKGEQAADDVRSHLDGGRAVDVSADFERVGAVSVSRCASLRHLERQLAA
jgi:hypothetical protein